MDVLAVILIVMAGLIWLAIAFWPALVADRKGHSFLGFFLFSLLFFPLALLVAYMVSDRSSQQVVAHTPSTQ